jgi:hypothetical protein
VSRKDDDMTQPAGHLTPGKVRPGESIADPAFSTALCCALAGDAAPLSRTLR